MKHFLYTFFALVVMFELIDFVTAAPIALNAAGAGNVSRPCSHKGSPSHEVDSSATPSTDATAVTIGASFMVTCENKSWMRQGAVGVTGATGIGAPLFTANIPYWFLSEEGGQYVGFVKKSGETDGKCYVTECR